jgi:hypothetical protein
LCLHPFAEEMNKSRRMALQQAFPVPSTFPQRGGVMQPAESIHDLTGQY